MAKRTENPLEAMVEQFSEALVNTVESFPQVERPFASEEIPAEEQLNHYLEIRENPQAFVELIRERQAAQELSETAIPKDVLEYARDMNRRVERENA